MRQLAELGTATVHEACGRPGALPPTIKPVSAAFRVRGPAFTVDCPPSDNGGADGSLSRSPSRTSPCGQVMPSSATEREVIRRLQSGESTLEILGLIDAGPG